MQDRPTRRPASPSSIRGSNALAAFVFCTLLVAAQAGAQPSKSSSAAPAAPPVSSSAPAQPAPGPKPLAETLTGQAQRAYEAARMVLQDGDPAGALAKFREAYDASKEPRLLWNMAVCEKQLRHYAKVQKLVEQYLGEGGDLLTQSDREAAKAAISALESFVSPTTITVNEPDASIEVDGEPVGKSPLAGPVLLDMGKRTFRVSKPGYKELSEIMTVPGGSPFQVAIQLQPASHEGTLRVVADSGDDVRIDDRPVALGQWEGKLPSGTHAVTISAPGKRPYKSDVLIQDDQTNTLRVTLEKLPKEAAPRGVPAWVWVTGGAVLAVGVGVGGYFVLKPKEQTPGQSVPGSLGEVALPLRWR